MRTYLDCIPCFVRQAITASRFVTGDQSVHEEVVRGVLKFASEHELQTPPPVMGREIHRLIRELSGDPDPYAAVKKKYNNVSMSLYPQVKERLQLSENRLADAVRLAIAGNIIDFGVRTDVTEKEICCTLDRALDEPLDAGVFKQFLQETRGAGSILYILDNAGEIVFDRLLIEELGAEKVTAAVRGGPVINDVTIKEAGEVGLTEVCRVVSMGDDAPGVIIENCNEEFQRKFAEADVVISKGQGNCETLSEADRDVYFLLMAKCAVIADHMGCEQGGFIFSRNRIPAKVGGERA